MGAIGQILYLRKSVLPKLMFSVKYLYIFSQNFLFSTQYGSLSHTMSTFGIPRVSLFMSLLQFSYFLGAYYRALTTPCHHEFIPYFEAYYSTPSTMDQTAEKIGSLDLVGNQSKRRKYLIQNYREDSGKPLSFRKTFKIFHSFQILKKKEAVESYYHICLEGT